MDTARVLEDSGSSGRRPRQRRRRWIVAAAVACFMAPLASGSASALSGGSGGSGVSAARSDSVPAFTHDPRVHCHNHEGSAPRHHGTSYVPQM